MQYVRHEDEIEWIDTNFHQPPPAQQRQESLCLYMFYNVNSFVQYEVSMVYHLVFFYLIALLTEVTVISLSPLKPVKRVLHSNCNRVKHKIMKIW